MIPKGADATGVEAFYRARSLDYLRRLPAESRQRIAAWAGAPPPGKGEDPVEVCVRAVLGPEGARRILQALDPDARAALLLFCVLGEPVSKSLVESRVRDFFGWPKPRTRTAVDAIVLAGLIGRTAKSDYDFEPLPALRHGLGHDLYVWLAGAASDEAPPMPLVRRLALLLAHAHADPVTLTAQRSLSIRWMERTQDVFSAGGFSANFLSECVSFLLHARALSPDPSDPDVRKWLVGFGTQSLFTADPVAVSVTFAERSDGSTWGSTLATLVVLERLRRTGDERPTIAALGDAGRAWMKEEHRGFVPYSDSTFSPAAIASAVRLLRALGLATPERADGTLRVARATPAAHAPRPFRCTVLPTFEIWVAEDADPLGTVDLGRIADLTSADRVAKFTLTQRSVQRAALGPGGASAAIARLAAAAEHGLPDNVRATLEGWARRATPMRPYRGGVIVAGSDDQAAFLRGRPDVLGEIAPGVFHVGSLSLTNLLRAADQADHALAPVVGDLPARGAHRSQEVTPDYAGAARAARARIDKWAQPGPKRAEPEPVKVTSPPAPTAQLSAGFSFDCPMTKSDLRRGWPKIAAAVQHHPWHDRVARCLDVDQLDELVDGGGDPETVRTGIERFFRGEAEPRPGARVATSTPSGPAPSRAPPWVTPPPGTLHDVLSACAASGAKLDVVYVNPAGVRMERRILPRSVVRAGTRDVLEARLADDGAPTRLEVDRIAAIRLILE